MTNYKVGGNWTPSAGAPPVGSGQSAVFDAAGSPTVNITSGAITPSSWIFTTNAHSYSIGGAAVNFSQAGPAGGIIDNAVGQTITISNNIGETVAGVQVQVTGPSTLILWGNNTYSGGTFVSNSGVVQVTSNNSVGTGAVTLSDGAMFQVATGSANLTFNNRFNLSGTAVPNVIDSGGTTLTLNGNIGGTGALEIVDTSFSFSTVVLNGVNTYTGGTTICDCASLALGDATHTASIIGDVTNFGHFGIFNANTSGINSITTDAGQTFFFGASTASNATLSNIHHGITFFGSQGGTDTATAGSATINNDNGATFFMANSNAGSAKITNSNIGATVFFDNASAASARITNDNGGTTQFGQAFSDAPTAGNATIVNNDQGKTTFKAFSTAGSAMIFTNDGGKVEFFGHSDGGKAQFITNGTGFVDFSHSNGLNSDGKIAAGSIAGTGTYFVGGIDLVVGGNNLSTEVKGNISDGCCLAGGLTKVGSGTLTLSGVNNTYTGATNVNEGTLLVTGSIESSFGVAVSFGVPDTGATLGGTGTVPQTFLFNGATLAPGLPTALGTLTVNDQLIFCDCTFYNVKVTSSGSDLTRVVPAHGTAFAGLDGTVRVKSLNSTYRFNSPYTILTAQGGFDIGAGPSRFSSLVTPTGINGSLSYTTTDVNLTLTSALGQVPGLNVNQRNVARVLDFGFNTTGNSGSLGGIFNGNVPLNLTQASGEIATGSQQATFSAMNMFLNLLTDPFIEGRGGAVTSGGGAQGYAAEDGASAYAARKSDAARAFAKMPTKAEVGRNDLFDPRWSVWGSAYGGAADIDGNAALGSNGANVRAFGLAAGLDYRISPELIAGFALAGGGTNFSVSGLGTGRSDLFQAGAFVRRSFGAGYVTGALAYGGQQVTTDRTVTIAGFDRLQARFNANTISGRIEGGYRFLTPWMGVTPYAAGQFTTFSLPAYAERALAGTGAFALNFAAKDVTAARTELGVRTDRSHAMQDGILTLRGRFAWAHDFNADRSVTAVFQTLPGAAFVVNGAAQARDSALTSASAEMKWLNGWSAAAIVESELSGISRTYSGKGVVRYSW